MIPPYLRRHLTSPPFIAVFLTFLVLFYVAFLHVSRSPADVLRSPYPSNISPPPLKPETAPPLTPETSRIALPNLPEDLYSEYFPTLQLPESILEYPLLAQKLYDFLTRPILDHSSEYEQDSYQSCPPRLSDNLVNPDQYNGDRWFWLEVNIGEIAYRRAVVVNWFENRLLRGEPVIGTGRTGQGRGIVLAGGNQVRRSLTSWPACMLTRDFGAGHDV